MSTLNSAAPARPVGGGARTFVRRLYFYGMALISFIAIMIATDNLLRVLDQIWFGDSIQSSLLDVGAYVRNALAGSGAVLLVATPIFLLHWAAIQRRREVEELQSGMRKFFLYAASGVAVGYAVVNAYTLLQGIAQLAVGMPLEESQIWPTGWFNALLMLIFAIALQWYFMHVAATDGDLGQEVGIAGTWRRLYQTIAGLFGLGLAILGSVGLVDTLVRLALGAAGLNLSVSWWLPAIGDNISQLLLGLLMVRLNWVYWQALAKANPQEIQSALRRFYLYVAVVAGALTVLIPLSEFVRDLLLTLFRYYQWNDVEVQDSFAMALAALPIGLFVWRWHWRFLQQEAAAYGESPQGATIRRLYYYAVALTGLVFVWLGAIDVVQVVVDWAIGQALIVGDPIWLEPLATGLSRLLIAAPIWAYHWQVSQQAARRDDEVGCAERASAPRKAYLYGVALIGGLVILYYLAEVVYRLLLVLSGDPTATFVGVEPASDLARCVIAAIIWIVHFMAIRGDAQMSADTAIESIESQENSPTPAMPSPVTSDERRAALEAHISQLEIELDAARKELAMLAPSMANPETL